jgi:hypothetical protein
MNEEADGTGGPRRNYAGQRARLATPFERRWLTANVNKSKNGARWRGESTGVSHIDAPWESDYIHTVPVRRIQVGQVWKKEGSGDSFLITKIYSEALATYAVLRKAGSETEPPIRVKVTNSGPMQTLAGFSYTQGSDSF